MNPVDALTEKQHEALELLAGPAKHILLAGGSRSGKTFLLVWAVVVRALKATRSRHAILRFRFGHVKQSIVYDTFPRVMQTCFPGLEYDLSKSDWYATMPNGAEIWFGGLDDKERTEKILGTEFATIYLNECSQIQYSARNVATTRLAQLVEDVEPYELMKLRLLNASHQAMSYLGLLAGHAWVHDTCQDPLFVAFLRRYMTTEAMPTLRPVAGVDLGEYVDQLIARFGSKAVQDTLERQVVDGSDRLPKFLLPVLREQVAAGGPIRCCALVLAAWSVYLESGLGEAGRPIADRRRAVLLEAVGREAERPGALLELTEVFGTLGTDARLHAAYVEARADLIERGPDAVLRELVDAPAS